jgi:hypothetical protein
MAFIEPTLTVRLVPRATTRFVERAVMIRSERASRKRVRTTNV